MPRTKINYNNTLIYKLVCNDLNVTDNYVGHTTNFNERKGHHKSVCNNDNGSPGYNYKVYQTIRYNGGWDNWDIIQVEEFPCKNKREACARERYQYEILNSNMNSQVPGRSKKECDKEWFENNKETRLLQMKQYREANQEAIKKKYLCECGINVQHCQKSRHQKTKIHLKNLNLIPENHVLE
jgi:hypothetical protein